MRLTLSCLLFLLSNCFIQVLAQDFTCIALGPEGGSDESLASSFLFKSFDSSINNGFATLEAGSIISSLRRALHSNAFYDVTTSIYDTDYAASVGIMRNLLRAFLISHSHIDHLSGLAFGSQSELMDGKKKIFGTKETLDNLVEFVFNGIVWPNMSNRGNNPIGMYSMEELSDQSFKELWEGSDLLASALPVTHGTLGSLPYNSTAFFVKNKNESQFLFFGDVGPDSLSLEPRNVDVWKRAAPLVVDKKLETIFIECSYDDSRPDHLLFGHLKPKYVLEELGVLASLVNANDPKESLRGINVVIIHIKPGTLEVGDTKMRIESQLTKHNDLGVIFRFPRAGDRFSFGKGKFGYDPFVNANRVIVSSCAKLSSLVAWILLLLV
eukprot:TRINITY_DN6410_c0_g1_i1.p1 TRINITY_DN6410_c0_g1~~TRINITY_DN6410_c0_g1_i1.p1  ORF type:complete len:382 (+),score=88.32 TRINITY_DN6410_c0_g1_i1:59-1204(+)